MLDAHLLRAHAQPLGEEDLTSGENRAILAALQAGQGPGPETDPEAVLELLPEALHDRCRELMVQTQQEPPLLDEKLLKDLGDRVLRLRERRLQENSAGCAFCWPSCQKRNTASNGRSIPAWSPPIPPRWGRYRSFSMRVR